MLMGDGSTPIFK